MLPDYSQKGQLCYIAPGALTPAVFLSHFMCQLRIPACAWEPLGYPRPILYHHPYVPSPIATLGSRFSGELRAELSPGTYHRLAHAELNMLSPPSEVKAIKLPAFAPQATSLADAALRTGSDQLLDALVYCCTEMLPDPAVARNWPV